MKINPVYQSRVLSLPAEVLLERLPSASKEELAVFIAVMAEPDFEVPAMAEKLDMTEKAFLRALESWKDAGVFRIDGAPTRIAEPKPKADEKPAVRVPGSRVEIHTTLPHYSSEEVAGVIEKRKDCSELLDSCQQILGKIFNAAEVEILIGLIDHLSLPHDYILLLCSFSVTRGKKSLRYIEKMAIDFFDRDIVTYAALETELKALGERDTLEKFVRKLFGFGSRSLIKKEKDFIAAWGEKYGFSQEMIQKAYEVTVSKTGDASMSYANAVLENWYAAGYRSPEEVDAAEAERARSREAAPSGSSFSTDDFYEAALQRSYESTDSSERSSS